MIRETTLVPIENRKERTANGQHHRSPRLTELTSDHEAQLFNYMRIARQPVGYLLNFGHKGELQWKRFVLSDLHPTPAQA